MTTLQMPPEMATESHPEPVAEMAETLDELNQELAEEANDVQEDETADTEQVVDEAETEEHSDNQQIGSAELEADLARAEHELLCQIRNAEMDCRAKEAILDARKEGVKEAKKAYDDSVTFLRGLANQTTQLDADRDRMTGPGSLFHQPAAEESPEQVPARIRIVDDSEWNDDCGLKNGVELDVVGIDPQGIIVIDPADNAETLITDSDEYEVLEWKDAEPETESETANDDEEDEEADDEGDWGETSITVLNLGTTIVNALFAANIETLGDLAGYSSSGCELTEIDKIGPKKAEAIEDALEVFWANRKQGE